MADLRKPPPTWAQLTYTSADSVAGARGGWGIKARSSITTDDVVAELLKGVSTRITEVSPTSNFPSDDELWTRPRRLLFQLVTGRPTLWHAASAGTDATGRPGNVYTHAAMLSSPEAGMRPIEYWRSADWLTPYGAVAVTAASDVGDLRPGAEITRRSTLDFIDHDDREYAVEWLLAAVVHAVSTRRSIVLVTDTSDEAAGWIGVFSFLTAPALARRITWVTYERGPDVEMMVRRGITVTCVPRDDLADLLESRPPEVLVLDPTWALDVPRGAEPWTAPGGQTFPADTAWGGAFLDFIALQPAQRMRVLVDIDGLTATLEPADVAVLPFHWPLSVALLSNDEAIVNNREAVLHDCLELAPPSALSSPACRKLLVELTAGRDIDHLMRRATDSAPGLAEALTLAAADRYVDGDWRSGCRWPKLTSSGVQTFRTGSGARVQLALRQALGDVDGSDAEALAAAKLLSFVLTYGLNPPEDLEEGPGVVTTLLPKVEARIGADDFDIQGSDRPDLHPRLLPVPSFPPSGKPRTHVAIPPAEEPADALSRATVQNDGPAAIIPPNDVPLTWEQRRAATPTVPHGQSRLRDEAPPGETLSRLLEELRRCRPGSAEALSLSGQLLNRAGFASASQAIVAATPATMHRPVLEAVAHLLLDEPAWNTADMDEWGRRQRLMLEAYVSVPAMPAALRTEILGWLTVVEALREAVGLERREVLGSPDPDVMTGLRADCEPGVKALADVVQRAGVQTVCRVVVAAIARGVHVPANSLLALKVPSGGTLGMAGIREGGRWLSPDRIAEIRSGSSDRLDALEVSMKSDRIWRSMDEIFNENAPHPSATHAQHHTQTKHSFWKGR